VGNKSQLTENWRNSAAACFKVLSLYPNTDTALGKYSRSQTRDSCPGPPRWERCSLPHYIPSAITPESSNDAAPAYITAWQDGKGCYLLPCYRRKAVWHANIDRKLNFAIRRVQSRVLWTVKKREECISLIVHLFVALTMDLFLQRRTEKGKHNPGVGGSRLKRYPAIRRSLLTSAEIWPPPHHFLLVAVCKDPVCPSGRQHR
jgi:hypothetical protein